MAKMFYTLEEACAKLGKSETQVKEMVTRGQLSEFRDRDRLMFKSEQVDLLSGSKADSKIDDVFKLADSGEADAISLSKSGSASAIGMADSNTGNTKEQTGISIFEAESTEVDDPSAVTRVTPSLAGGSALGGSGLLEATRDGGDSAMGADLIKDSFGTGQSSALAGSGSMPSQNDGGAMFEGAPSESATPAPLMAAMAEPYDAAGSGLVGGFALGMVLTLAIGMTAVLLGLSGGSNLLDTLGSNLMIFVGAGAAVTFLAGILGWVLGRRG